MIFSSGSAGKNWSLIGWRWGVKPDGYADSDLAEDFVQ